MKAMKQQPVVKFVYKDQVWTDPIWYKNNYKRGPTLVEQRQIRRSFERAGEQRQPSGTVQAVTHFNKDAI